MSEQTTELEDHELEEATRAADRAMADVPIRKAGAAGRAAPALPKFVPDPTPPAGSTRQAPPKAQPKSIKLDLGDQEPALWATMAYLGPAENGHVHRRGNPHIPFAPNPDSNGHPVAEVTVPYGMWMVENCFIKHNSKGELLDDDDWRPMYAWLDEVRGSRVHTLKRTKSRS